MSELRSEEMIMCGCGEFIPADSPLKACDQCLEELDNEDPADFDPHWNVVEDFEIDDVDPFDRDFGIEG